MVSASPFGREGNTIVEAWTIEACAGQRFTYRIMMMPMNDSVGVGVFPMGEPR